MNESRWTTLLFLTSLFFGAAIIVIMVLAMNESEEDLPEHVDIVLYEDGRGWSRGQARACLKNMGFAHRIYILHKDVVPEQEEHERITYVKFDGLHKVDAFEVIPKIENISKHAIFLGAQTVPLRKIRLTYLFHGSRPRLFNTIRDTAETDMFKGYYESDPAQGVPESMPAMVMDVEKLRSANNWRHYMFLQATEGSVVLRNNLSRDSMFDVDEMGNVEKQLEELEKHTPTFVTFHVTNGPSGFGDPSPLSTGYERVVKWLDKHF